MASLKDFFLKTYNLPNGGGTFQSPAPIVQGKENPMPQAEWGNGAPVYQNPAPVNPASYAKPSTPLFTSSTPATTAVTSPTTSTSTKTAPRSKYINPETGNYFTPQEYANYVASRIPASKKTGDIPKYAGDAMTKPDESSADLTNRARDLNIARNDIATGTTDPYKAASDSGVAYSPQELAAIEKAYAGIYDPALNDVFTRLKKKEDEAKAKQEREDTIFSTNESIRQWKATTGSKKSGGDDSDTFTQSQLNSGASRAGIGMEAFNNLDSDLKNFYINPPSDVDELTGKSYPMYQTFSNLIKQVKNNEIKIKDATDEIMNSNLPDTVKHYFIDQLPVTQEEKKGLFARIWGAITGE